jgi:N-acetylmuramoyl-L-alanine amidase/Putative peptidoglycan binding domain
MLTLYPPATVRPVANRSGTMTLPTRGLIVHVTQGYGSPFGWFNTPSSLASSHLWLSKTGVYEQFVDFATKAWAQEQGNPYWISVETEGYTTEDLTLFQITRLAELYAWGMAEMGWPAKLAAGPDDSGLGTHAMGGSAWGGHPCPGDLRTSQLPEILALASQIHLTLADRPGDGVDRYIGRPTLKVGIGLGLARHVVECQNALNICNGLEGAHAAGRLAPDGVFGPLTAGAVSRFQARTFGGRGPVAVDGVCGSATWGKLGAVLTDMRRVVGS